VSATNNGNGTWSLAAGVLNALSDATYSVTARATDVAGNIGTDPTSNELKIDTVAPTVAINTLNTNNNRPQLTGTVNDNAAVITLQVGSQNVTATNNGNGTWTLAANTLTALADATYDVIVSATDAAGNVGNDATTNDLTVDTTAPLVTVDPLTTTDNRPQLTGMVNDPTATVSITVATQTVAATNNGDGTWTLADNALATIADGTYNVAATATDTFGNARTDSTTNELTIDATAPTVTVNTLSTNNNRPALSGTVNDNGATISVTVAAQTVSAVNNGNGTWSLPVNTLTTLADGTYNVTVTGTDVLGNVGTDATTNELTIDATAPVVTINTLVVADHTPALSGTVNDTTATISVHVGSQTVSATNNGNGTWTLADNTLTTLADGVYDVDVSATDTFSNVGTDATTNELTVDTTGPVIALNGASSVTVNCGEGYTDEGATANDTRQGDVSSSIVVTGSVTTQTPPGTYHLSYNVQDSVGNAATQVQRTVTVQSNCPLAVQVLDLAPQGHIGSSYTFSALAVNAIGSVSYQWQRDIGGGNWQNLGTGGSDYVIASLVNADAGSYRCEATDAVTTAYSGTVVLTVTAAMPVAGLAGLSMVTIVTALAGAAGLRRKR